MNERTLQLWPGGQTIHVSGERPNLAVRLDRKEPWREATPEETRKVEIEELAERYQQQEILCCDSCLVDEMLKAGESLPGGMAEEWSWEKVQNLRPDPSEWDIEQCKEWLDDHGIGIPDPDPWSMKRPELIREAHGDSIADEIEAREEHDTDDGPPPELSDDAEIVNDASDEAIREALIEKINNKEVDGLGDWRDAVNDNAEMEEVYEWYRVTGWLAGQLAQVGEVVLDNNYGEWWGRTCTGQNNIMDGTLQKVAALHVRELSPV